MSPVMAWGVWRLKRAFVFPIREREGTEGLGEAPLVELRKRGK
jgi:hypothetical protein